MPRASDVLQQKGHKGINDKCFIHVSYGFYVQAICAKNEREEGTDCIIGYQKNDPYVKFLNRWVFVVCGVKYDLYPRDHCSREGANSSTSESRRCRSPNLVHMLFGILRFQQESHLSDGLQSMYEWATDGCLAAVARYSVLPQWIPDYAQCSSKCRTWGGHLS
uniref:DUF300-domain-containing protein n=1 Tax=Ulva partita TaxID=1605170 RepID=A0A1C9ZWE4_9CHLO|nr:DUF300-domain-containing protein [Ulva partita]